MYLKLALRNARRSISDYLLYIFTMIILTSIMCLSNCIAVFGNVQIGFETASLPLLIAIIMVILILYINIFMIKQRAKEFATYSLLGMDKNRLSVMYISEISVIGAICFVFGVLIGISIYKVCIFPVFHISENQITSAFALMIKSIWKTFVYFCFVEFVAALFMKRKICNLQISDLMKEKNRNQKIVGNRHRLWITVFVCSILTFAVMLIAIAFISDILSSVSISLIALPMFLSVIAFYKCFFSFMASKRISKSDMLYKDTAIYSIAEMTTGIKTSSTMNSVFCSCLLCSACSFVFGVLLLNENMVIFSHSEQQWMGFIQISLCVIFIVIYFSILSLLQVVELKQQVKKIKILFYIGKSQSEIKSLIKTQTLAKLFLPTSMCFILMVIGMPFMNYKLNKVLAVTMNNEVLKACGLFIVCFVALYICYYQLVYLIIKKYINSNLGIHV